MLFDVSGMRRQIALCCEVYSLLILVFIYPVAEQVVTQALARERLA
jgi:hypothetical protein